MGFFKESSIAMKRNDTITRLRYAAKSALRPAWETAVWVIKMVIPITLGISVLEYLGVIGWISDMIAPLFNRIGLPGSSGLVFLTAALSNNYATVAVIATLGFDYRSVVILAVMALICHNLPIESAVQHKTGVSAVGMTLLRLVTAFIAAALLNLILPEQMSGTLHLPAAGHTPTSWNEVAISWITTVVPLCLQIGVIIIALNIIQQILREFHLLDLISVPLRPFMAIFGLPQSTSFLRIISNIVGLTYGGAPLIDEIHRGGISRHDSLLLNTHIAISHSLLEDTVIFYTIGIGLIWLLMPRILLAICAVWILRAIQIFIGRSKSLRPSER